MQNRNFIGGEGLCTLALALDLFQAGAQYNSVCVSLLLHVLDKMGALGNEEDMLNLQARSSPIVVAPDSMR